MIYRGETKQRERIGENMKTSTKPVVSRELAANVPALHSHEGIEAMRIADEIVRLSVATDKAAAKARAARARYDSAIARLPGWMKSVLQQNTGTNPTTERAG